MQSVALRGPLHGSTVQSGTIVFRIVEVWSLIMTDPVLNLDGSVAMTFPPAVPSRGSLEGWIVRHVCSGTHGPVCPHGKVNGTYASVRKDVESFNGLLKIIGEFSNEYGHRPQPSKITDGTFRWTFEREYPDGHRGSDMIIASKIR